MKNTVRIHVLVWILLVGASISVVAQQTNDRRLKLAESYEQSKDYDNALRIYGDLFKEDKNNAEYFNGYVRILTQVQDYQAIVDACDLVKEAMLTPSHWALMTSAHFRLGNIEESANTFETALSKADDLQAWAQVAQVFIQYRLFDKAIATLVRSRKTQGPSAFANELCQLYTSEKQYENACAEIVLMLSQKLDPGVVRGRLAAIASTDKGKDVSLRFLQQQAQENSHDMRILSLYEWFLREIGEWQQAWEIVKSMQESTDGDTRKALQFANAAKNAGAIRPALAAFEYIIANASKKDPNIHSALYNYARTMEMVLQSEEQLSHDEVDRTLALYDEIIDRFPKNKLASDAKVRKADILVSYKGEISKAIELLTTTADKDTRFVSGGEAALLLFDLHFSTEKYDDAQTALQTYRGRYSKFNELKDKFTLREAHVLLALEQFDSALTVLSRVSQSDESAETNDALRIQTLLQENKPEEHAEGLAYYFAAQRAESRQDTIGALHNYTLAQESSRYAVLGERSSVRIIELHMHQGNVSKAEALCTSHLEQFEPGVFSDKVLWLQGQALEEQDLSQRAMEVYTRILREFPRSPFKREARNRINELRSS